MGLNRKFTGKSNKSFDIEIAEGMFRKAQDILARQWYITTHDELMNLMKGVDRKDSSEMMKIIQERGIAFSVHATPKVLVIGDKGCGKDTLFEWWKDWYGLTFRNSSEMALEIFLLDDINMAARWGRVTMEDFEDVKRALDAAGDNSLRAFMYERISDYNKDNPARLAEEIMKRADAYGGMRSEEELQACVDKGIFDYVIGIDATQRVPAEDSSSNTIDIAKYADIIIQNNTDLASFYIRARKLGDAIFK